MRRRFVPVVMGLVLFIGIAGIGLGFVLTPRAEEQRQRTLMRQKLTEIQNSIEGLITRDFDMVGRSAGQLETISVVDEVLTKYANRQYSRLAEDFRWAAEKMSEMAHDENLEGATLYFSRVTESCIECHNLMRDLER